ncbi:hypothetical protein HU200_044715 [Digitaria exilis]|uniref:Thioredoxin domain-containing protein n=1 Tax=Digitaria exilis TaxID=1010633 RepID=A0A835EFA4_9POAL|nr:hypothetical protein HU200_044715 [Digitaria exilis]
MDPVSPRRGRLPIHLLVVSLTVLVALTVRSGAEVITLTEETFSDKVPPALLVSSSLLSAYLPDGDRSGGLGTPAAQLVKQRPESVIAELLYCSICMQTQVALSHVFVLGSPVCKNLGTLWEDLGKVMEGEDEIEIGQVDCGVSKPVCSKVDIHSYPTFKVFYEGEEVAKYKGPRDVESLKNFVLIEAEKAGEGKLQAD